MSLRLYNTLTRTVEAFTPRHPPAVTMYVCGPTVYDDPHIGHARSAYVFDVLRRYLEYRTFQVRFVRNVTDIDDKIIAKARQELGTGELKAKCQEVADRYLNSYHKVLDQFGIAKPTIEPKATEHVLPDPKNVEATKKIDASMAGFISELIAKNMAYPAGGDVYFPVRKFPGYGKLSNRSLDELQAGARVEPGEHKEDPLDFALWKAAKSDEPSWNSPWGPGRPGWHIECAVMSTAYLGDAFDIHGGGLDLIFPHHENEIAQAQALGKPFATYWIHNGLLTVNGEKMSKSLGNVLTPEHILIDYPHPDYLKLLFLKTHYRSPIDYSQQRMQEAKKNWEEFSRFFQHGDQRGIPAAKAAPSMEAQTAQQRFEEAMDDDVNTPKAVAALFELVNYGQQVLQSGDAASAGNAKSVSDVLIKCGTTLGLFLQGMREEHPEQLRRVQQVIATRDAARTSKDFVTADALRRQLEGEGVLLSDTPNGTFWRRRP